MNVSPPESPSSPVAQRFLVGALLLLLTVPLLLAFLVPLGFPPQKALWRLLHNKGLAGIQSGPAPRDLRIGTWIDGAFQQKFTRWFNENFFGREILLRTIDQLYYTLFHKTYILGNNVVLGRENSLFFRDVLAGAAGFGPRVSPEELEETARQAAELQELLKRRGIAFCFLLTPEKTDLVSDDIPKAYRKFLPRIVEGYPADYLAFRAALDRAGVPYVDGRAIARGEGSRFALPPAPPGGIHWTTFCCHLASEALLDRFEAISGKKIGRPRVLGIEADVPPEPLDRDLFNLMNLWEEPAYPSVKVRFEDPAGMPVPPDQLTVVAGSYGEAVVEYGGLRYSFRRTNMLNYYTQLYDIADGAGMRHSPDQHVDIGRDVLGSRFVVLEINERSFGWPFYRDFLRDALGYLRENPAPTP